MGCFTESSNSVAQISSPCGPKSLPLKIQRRNEANYFCKKYLCGAYALNSARHFMPGKSLRNGSSIHFQIYVRKALKYTTSISTLVFCHRDDRVTDSFWKKNPLLFHYRSRSLFLEKKKFDVRIKRENVKCIKAALGRMEGKNLLFFESRHVWSNYSRLGEEKKVGEAEKKLHR